MEWNNNGERTIQWDEMELEFRRDDWVLIEGQRANDVREHWESGAEVYQ